MRAHSTYPIRAVLVGALLLLLAPAAGAAQREPIQTQARNAYVEAMTALADGYQFAAAVAVARGEVIACPVPGSSFVASFGAPRSGHTHQGTDMMAPDGTPIYAPEPGVYRQHGPDSFYLDGASGAQWFGTHLQGHARGDGPVRAGELVAYVGHSGNASASAPHLHIEYHPGGGAAVEHYPTLAAACLGAPAPEAAVPGVTDAEQRFCSFVSGGRPSARFIACLHVAEGHAQGQPGHRWADYVRQARQLRRYLNALADPTCSGPADCPALIRRAFTEQGVGWRGSEAVAVATCESGLNPSARGGGGGNYAGLFQQSLSYWPGRAAQYGFAGASPYDPWANAMVSAGMVRDTGGWSHWSCAPG